MNTLNVLRTSLLDLLWELRDTGIGMIIGGGYGIFLKSAYIHERRLRTLLVNEGSVFGVIKLRHRGYYE